MCRQQLVPIRNFTCIVAYTWGGGERVHPVRDTFYVIFRLLIFFHIKQIFEFMNYKTNFVPRVALIILSLLNSLEL